MPLTRYLPPLAILSGLLASPAAAAPICPRGGEIACHLVARTGADGEIHGDAEPQAFGPAELQDAYHAMMAASTAPTVAIIDAYGYANLEHDLAIYRAQFRLPPCTRATGCLRIVNGAGDTAPLPPEPPPDNDWTNETGLDVDMASAGCPACKILVVQSADTSLLAMATAQRTAVRLGATVISDSWGAPNTSANELASEPYFDHPGVPTFVSTGDRGYNEGGDGPHYPSTSAHVIAVGGTRLVRSAGARGWSEDAWAMAGSSCSDAIARPAYQAGSPCRFRATGDVAAVADLATGVATFSTNAGGWYVAGGTSAASPLVAALIAGSGLAPQVDGAWLAQHAGALNDVTSGTNGGCGTALCNAGPGWDGPTGYGTLDVAALLDTTGAGDAPGTGDDRHGVTGGCAATGAPGELLLGLGGLALLRRRRRRAVTARGARTPRRSWAVPPR